ncbi:MAG: MFS transporter [Deltaproteobacteria bacterium]
MLPKIMATTFKFLQNSTPRERRALAASTLGWMLDGMDITLYAMVLAELMRELNLSKGEAGLLASLTLVASAAGGILFGFVADRLGRRFALMASIVVYSVFTAACGLSHGLLELAIFRCLLGLGMGGEWGSGAALVAETWRPEYRAKALGIMQSGYAIGYALAALINWLILRRFGWRAVFFAGLLPALLTLWIQRRVEESPLWLAREQGLGTRDSGLGKETPPARILNPESRILPTADGSLFSKRHLPNVLITLLMNSAALFGWWGLFTWIPPYLALPAAQGGKGLSVAASSLWIVVMQVGMWIGYVSFGFISDALGRKRTYAGYLLLAAVLVPFYAGAGSPAMLLVLGPLLAFFGTGHFTGFGIIASELFPTSFRGLAMGLTYNFGRAISAAAPWAIGFLAARFGFGSAFWLSGAAFLIAGLLSIGLPETRAKALE